ncbi:radical SAM protein [Clostridium butanoliproducens]|uniref:radical SAM protein n=1 Tax=Clostridium butanoliproducens TaxID=2991837 RepID=UPI0024B9AEA6|nr:radical SAM protein [Clostridium butanoliproducens]MDU1349839.1 radical SAM protein [Clostridium argentinense]
MKNLSIHLTDQCNNSCIFCVVDSYQGCKEKVNRKLVYNYLKSNANKGYERVNIHGGEPTVIPEFLEILEYINEFNYPTISLQTNARLLANMEFAKKVVNKGVDLFVVSIHGKDAQQHDELTTVKGSFEEAIEGIKNVIKLGKKVRINTVVCIQNKDNLVEIIDFCMDLGVNHINISGMHPTGKALKNYEKVVPKYEEIIPQIKAAADAVAKREVACTIEGVPLCLLDEYVKYCIDWDEDKYKLLFRNIILDDYDTFMRVQERKLGTPCMSCSQAEKCGGVYNEYIMFNNWDEFEPVNKEERVLVKI